MKTREEFRDMVTQAFRDYRDALDKDTAEAWKRSRTSGNAVLDEYEALKPPTREEVEKAIRRMLDAREKAFRMAGFSGYGDAITAVIQAEEDLVLLATRGKP